MDHAPIIIQEPSFVPTSERSIRRYGSIHDPTSRTSLLELHRTPNHPSAATTHAIDIESSTTMSRLPEEREKTINYPEVLLGTRPHAGPSSMGKLRYDIPSNRIDGFVFRSMHSNGNSKEIHNILPMNQA